MIYLKIFCSSQNSYSNWPIEYVRYWKYRESWLSSVVIGTLSVTVPHYVWGPGRVSYHPSQWSVIVSVIYILDPILLDIFCL